MSSGIYDRLLRREIGVSPAYSNVRAIYGNRTWVRDLDVVNELDGHSGCVNALSWSKSGKLLASGSDDQHVNIHEYQADSSVNSFKLSTSIATGHTANIFSVKFMPHSNDRTIVTAAGDSQVRVFDIEYTRRNALPVVSNVASSNRACRFVHRGVQYLCETDTNARVYRSHGDRVKRIVTESSPHLFLSCSEDGEVRQWDLRQPSSAYPSPESGDAEVPPPLISYKHHQLDLNTISCSPSQPHYIALGGAHLHCFLHDRRMLGRDRYHERGQSLPMSWSNEHDDDLLGEATRCVRRFAPNGQSKMKRQSNGHITACKISDANPNEMIVSWSGDWIYSFDLVRSPDAREHRKSGKSQSRKRSKLKAEQSREKKRKTKHEQADLRQNTADRDDLRPSSSSVVGDQNEDSEMALRVRYENGQSENIALRLDDIDRNSLVETSEHAMNEIERKSYRVANTSVKIRKHIFELGEPKEATVEDPTGHAVKFTSALGFSSSIIDDMDEIIRTWRYPVDPEDLDVVLQTTLRRHRESTRRFVQAAGTISRLMGGKLRTAGGGQHPTLRHFAQIVPAPNETTILDPSEQFYYDFIKAIVLWLDSGPGALVENFSRRGNNTRFPLPPDSSIDAIDDLLIPYLLRLASDQPIQNIDASPFETDSRINIFASERAAVIAFSESLKIPFEDLTQSPSIPGFVTHTSISQGPMQDRRVALRFWAFGVARGLLFKASEGVNHAFVDRAFGGIGRTPTSTRDEERHMRQRHAHIDPEENDPVVEAVGLEEHGDSRLRTTVEDAGDDEADEDGDENMLFAEDVRSTTIEDENDDNDDDNQDSDNERDGEDNEDSDSGDAASNLLFSRAFRGARRRTMVNDDTPTIPHHRHYRGHCNVKTVKDVNFYGLNDEYVVSGSDCGNLFIWDKRTAELVNILEGDGEVVNVVQGHPYEPMLAVSGIDSTVKIFGADARSRHDARRAIGVQAVDDSDFSSLRYGMRRRRMRPRAVNAMTQTGQQEGEDAAMAEPLLSEHQELRGRTLDYDSDDTDNPDRAPTPSNGLASRKRMKDVYRITSENDENRQGGNREAFITRSMLAELAANMRLRVAARAAGGDGDDEDGDGDTMRIVIGPGGVSADDCSVM